MVTLLGSILRNTDKEILFSIAENLGDAKALQLSGTVWFAKRTLIGSPTEADGHDMIKMPYPIANLRSQEQQNARAAAAGETPKSKTPKRKRKK